MVRYQSGKKMTRKEIIDKGYVVIPNLIDKSLCDKWISKFRPLVTQELKNNIKSIIGFRPAFHYDSSIIDIIINEKVINVARDILDDSFKNNDTHIIMNNCRVVLPNMRGVLGIHRDLVPCIIPSEDKELKDIVLPQIITFQIYLSDCLTEENGPFRILPNSHKYFEGHKELQKPLIPIYGKAGDCVIFRADVYHSGSSNLSNQERWVMQFAFARRIIGHHFYPFIGFEFKPEARQKINNLPKDLQRVFIPPRGAFN